MNREAQLEELLELLDRLGIAVRPEHLGGSGGGLCTIRDRRVAFIDLDADVATRFQRCLADVASLPEFEDVFMTPALRESVEAVRSEVDAVEGGRSDEP